MNTENNAARLALIGTIITALGGMIVALITVFGNLSKPVTSPVTSPSVPPQVGTNHGRKTIINAEKVNYSEGDLIIHNRKTAK